jgi:hypothetical protein
VRARLFVVNLTGQERWLATIEELEEGLERMKLDVACASMGSMERAVCLKGVDDALGRIEDMRRSEVPISQTDVLELLAEALLIEGRIQRSSLTPHEKALA